MRAIWSGTISFGLVNIPVGVYPAAQEKRISFNLLHKEDKGRVRNQRVCAKCGDPVDYDDLERGYEYEKGSYVTLSDEDLEKARLETSENITIVDFVDPDEIDPIYYDKPYHLAPGKKSERMYVLLRDALTHSHRVGIAKFVLRTKEHLAVVRPAGQSLVLDTIRYADELREAPDVPSEHIKVDERELEMAELLIDKMAAKFKPEKYKDTHREAMMELIDEKLEGQPVTPKTEKKQATNVIDLMAALKASLEKTGKDDASEDEEAADERPAARDGGKRRRAAASGSRRSAAGASASGASASGAKPRPASRARPSKKQPGKVRTGSRKVGSHLRLAA